MKKSLAIAGGLLTGFATNAAGLDRQNLEKKLQELAKAPPPTKLAPGDMCYDMAAPADRIDYVCPACQEKTLYSRKAGGDWKIQWIILDADRYRKLAKQLQDNGLDCKLDESAFCQKCGKDAKEKTFVLETKWTGQEKPHRAALRDIDDLKLILEFLEGKKVHAGAQGAETPLKNYLPRIRELLGLESETGSAKQPEKKKTP